MTGAPLIRAVEVSKHYRHGSMPVEALDRVTFSIACGEFAAVVGPSGSGKTSLLNLLGGLDVPSRGTLEVAGMDLSRLNESERTRFRRRTVGFVFQDFGLVPELTVWDNVVLPLAFARQLRERARARELLEQVQLAHRMHHRPSELSGGEMQRVALARALVMQPSLVLADEPTGNLDSVAGAQIFDLLRSHCRERGVTVVVSTHNLELARRADRILQLRDGRLCT